MIREIRRNNETLQIGTFRERHLMESTAPFQRYETAVDYLRRFMIDSYNMTVLRKILYDDSYQFDVHLLSDQEVISQIAKKVIRGQLLIARRRAAQYGGGSSSPSVKEVEQAEGKKWSKKEYVASFLKESEPVTEETNWVAFKVLYDDTDEPVAGVKLKIKLPDGTTDMYTTDGAGKIYISGLPDGTCDVQEMLDNDALEVVKTLHS